MTEAAHNLPPAQPRDYGLYDSLLSPVVVVNEALNVVYFNQTFAQFFQLPPRKIRGKPIDAVIVSEQLKASLSVKQCLADASIVVTPEITIVSGPETKAVVLKFFSQDDGVGGRMWS